MYVGCSAGRNVEVWLPLPYVGLGLVKKKPYWYLDFDIGFWAILFLWNKFTLHYIQVVTPSLGLTQCFFLQDCRQTYTSAIRSGHNLHAVCSLPHWRWWDKLTFGIEWQEMFWCWIVSRQFSWCHRSIEIQYPARPGWQETKSWDHLSKDVVYANLVNIIQPW